MDEAKRTILVPVLDGDITEEAFGMARPLVSDEDTRLVLVHVAPTDDTGHLIERTPAGTAAATDCRWRRLASIAPERTFVEAVAGDPADVVLDEAERFGRDTIVLGPVAAHQQQWSDVADQQSIGPAAIDALIESLPVGLLVADRHGRLVYANAEARALHAERLDRVQWAVTRALLTEDVVVEDNIELMADKQPRRWLSVRVTPLRTTGVGVHAALVAISDVTARKRLDNWSPVIESLVNL